jgi:hypothetical protein
MMKDLAIKDIVAEKNSIEVFRGVRVFMSVSQFFRLTVNDIINPISQC